MAKVKAKAKTVSVKAAASAPRARQNKAAAKKAAFLAKVKASSSSSKSPLGLSKSSGVQKKRKSKKETTSIALGTMGALSLSLLDACRATTNSSNNKQPGASIITQKARHQVLKQEAPRLTSVIQHPQFIVDPIAAIKRHLEAVLPDKPKSPSSHTYRHKSEQEKKQQRREKKRRRAAGNDSTTIMTH